MSSLMVASGGGHFVAIRFEFGRRPEEAISILSDRERYVDVEWDRVTDSQGMDLVDAFIDKHLGNRAMIWADSELLLTGMRHEWEAYHRKCKWERTQESGLRTLLWTAYHSPAKMYMPEVSQIGLRKGVALHDATKQVLMAQAAFYALSQSWKAKK